MDESVDEPDENAGAVEDEVDALVVDGRHFSSLNDALRVVRIPLENHRFIQTWVDALRVASFLERGNYIRAVRRDNGPSLEIHSGYTNGFVSEAEIVDALGDVRSWTSNRGTGLWGVTHPKAGHAVGGSGAVKADRPDYGTCPACFMAFSAAGTCSCDT